MGAPAPGSGNYPLVSPLLWQGERSINEKGARRDIPRHAPYDLLMKSLLYDGYVNGRGTFLALLHVKGNAIAFVQGSEAGRIDA